MSTSSDQGHDVYFPLPIHDEQLRFRILTQQHDVTLRIGGKLYHVHKELVTHENPWMDALINGPFAESGEKEIEITDPEDAAQLPKLLKYYYVGLRFDITANTEAVESLRLFAAFVHKITHGGLTRLLQGVCRRDGRVAAVLLGVQGFHADSVVGLQTCLREKKLGPFRWCTYAGLLALLQEEKAVTSEDVLLEAVRLWLRYALSSTNAPHSPPSPTTAGHGSVAGWATPPRGEGSPGGRRGQVVSYSELMAQGSHLLSNVCVEALSAAALATFYEAPLWNCVPQEIITRSHKHSSLLQGLGVNIGFHGRRYELTPLDVWIKSPGPAPPVTPPSHHIDRSGVKLCLWNGYNVCLTVFRSSACYTTHFGVTVQVEGREKTPIPLRYQIEVEGPDNVVIYSCCFETLASSNGPIVGEDRAVAFEVGARYSVRGEVQIIPKDRLRIKGNKTPRAPGSARGAGEGLPSPPSLTLIPLQGS